MACKLDVDKVVQQLIEREVKNISPIRNNTANTTPKFNKEDINSIAKLNKQFGEKVITYEPSSFADTLGSILISISDSLYNRYIKAIDVKRAEENTKQARKDLEQDAQRAGVDYTDDYLFQKLTKLVDNVEETVEPLNKKLEKNVSSKNNINKITNVVEDTPEQKVFFKKPKAEIKNMTDVSVDNTSGKNTGHLISAYNYSSNNDGKTNVTNILKAIKESSTNRSYKMLATILLEISQNQNILDGIFLNLSNKNEYSNNKITLDVSEKNSDKFNKSFQYNFLHEIVHHFTVNKMNDGSALSKTLVRNIQGLITELESEENLQKAIDLFGLKTTVPELQNKLQQLRMEQQTSQEESLVSFSSELERSILNPLINPFEFVASIMNDENTQKWMGEVKITSTETSILNKFIDFVKGVFNNFVRSLNLDVTKFNQTALNDGLTNVIKLLSSELKTESQLDLFASLKPIAKLAKTVEKEKNAIFEIKKENIQNIEERRKLLWNEYNKIQISILEKEEKSKQIEAVYKRITTITKSIEKLKNEFSIAIFEEENFKAVEIVKEILKKENPTVSELFEAIDVFQTNDKLLKLTIKEDFKENLPPELIQAIKNINANNSLYKNELVDIAKNKLLKIVRDEQGRDIDLKNFYENNDPDNYGTLASFLNGEDTHNPMVQAVATFIYDMGIKTKDEIADSKIKDEKMLNRFVNQFDFKQLLLERAEYDPITNVTKIIKNFKTRVSNDYYKHLKSIRNSANNILNKRSKIAFLNSEYNKANFIVDIRFLYPSEFNEDLGSKILTEDNKKNYLKNLKDFLKKEYTEFSDEFIEVRLNELLKQAEYKIEAYKEAKLLAFELIKEDNEQDVAEQTRLELNWLSYNSPFLLLNESYSLSEMSMDLKTQIPYSKTTAKVTEDGETKFVSFGRVDPITNKFEKKRLADNYLVAKKPRRKDFSGKLTGYISDEYTKWENDYVEKVLPAIENNTEIPLTMFGFLKFVQELQKEYLKFLPNYLKKDVSYFQMLDVSKDWEEVMSEVSLFNKLKLAPELIWDDVVNTASIPLLEEQDKKIDLLTQQIKKEFNPNFQKDSFNQKGLGDLKTNDVFKYFDFIRNAAITYKYKSEYENNFKIAQFLYSQGVLKTIEGEAFNADKQLFDWMIDNKLYNEVKDSRQQTDPKFYTGESSKKYKLTRAEREKLKIYNKQVEDILKKYPDIDSAPEEVVKTYNEIISNISGIKRQRTGGTTYDLSESYTRFKFMGWSPLGRVYDTINTSYINNFSAAIDGRIINKSGLLKSLGVVNASYGAGYVGAMGLTTSGILGGMALIGLTPFTLPTIGAIGAIGVIGTAVQTGLDQTALKQKTSQLLYRLGALEHFDYLSETDRVSITNGNLQLLKPYTLLEKADVYNKATTAIAVLFTTKIKDKNGDLRPLWDAFIIDNGDLIWNSDFLPQSAYELSFTGETSKDWISLRKNTERVMKFVHGDMASGFSTSLSRKETSKRALLFMKTYLVQEGNKAFSERSYDPLTNTEYTGRWAGYSQTIVKALKGKPYDEVELIAYRQMQFQLSLWTGFLLAGYILAKSVSDDDKEEWYYMIMNFFNRNSGDTGVTLDPDLGKYDTLAKTFPQFKTYLEVVKLATIIIPKSISEGDEMSRQEMASNKMLSKNVLLETEMRDVYLDEEDKENDILTEVKFYKMYDPSIDREYDFVRNPEKYQKVVPEHSRIGNQILKILPFTSAYKSLENSKKVNNLIK